MNKKGTAPFLSHQERQGTAQCPTHHHPSQPGHVTAKGRPLHLVVTRKTFIFLFPPFLSQTQTHNPLALLLLLLSLLSSPSPSPSPPLLPTSPIASPRRHHARSSRVLVAADAPPSLPLPRAMARVSAAAAAAERQLAVA
ncbi:hypothetical protein DAI22_03g156750 [Oryza sativa Japonica Group]|nr:hypothetical protein DAI22_03g156750 [Oryza sativa Japonica Group]